MIECERMKYHIYIYKYIYIYILSLKKNVENVFTTFFLKTLLHQKRVENVGPYPPIALKTLTKNVRKTFGKRSKNVGVEQPCWAPADGELAWGTCLASRRGLHGP